MEALQTFPGSLEFKMKTNLSKQWIYKNPLISHSIWDPEITATLFTKTDH